MRGLQVSAAVSYRMLLPLIRFTKFFTLQEFSVIAPLFELNFEDVCHACHDSLEVMAPSAQLVCVCVK